MVRSLKGTPREVFTEIYRRNIWGYQETVSGGSSTLHYTEQLRQTLPALIAELRIGTLLDAPCGDFNWMSDVELPVKHYIGCDIVPLIVQNARIRHGRPGREFRTLDLCHDPLPDADLLLCRDCFIHLSEDMIFLAVDNILLQRQVSSDHHLSRRKEPHDSQWRLVHGESLCGAVSFPAAAPRARRLDAAVRQASAGIVGS
jgi:hypothetical protein